MSADVLCNRVLAALRESRVAAVAKLRNCKPRAPIQMPDGAVVPPATAEEIALYAVEVNATVDTLDRAISLIQDEFKKLTSPEQPDEPIKPKGKEPIYG